MEDSDVEKDNTDPKPNDKQMYSALSFCVMLVFVGIPLWWKTTEVYRVSLPYSEIDALSNLNVQIQMNVHLVTVDDSYGMNLKNGLEKFFDTFKLYKINIKLHSVDRALIGSCKTLEEVENKIKHPHYEGSLQLFELPGLSRFTPKNIILGQFRTIYFSSDTDAVKLYNFLKTDLLKEELLLEAMLQTTSLVKDNLNLKHKMAQSDEFDILFTVLNPDPDSLDVKFDIKEAIEDHIEPFLNNLRDMNVFHVKSQWLYFVSLQAQPKFLNTSENGLHFALSEDLLPHVITPLEKKLASHVSKHPCLNFVLFVPPCDSSPLRIYTKKGFPVEGAGSFVSPRWGGIQIYNPDRKSCSGNDKALVEPDKDEVMAVFVKQLQVLLGISELSDSDSKLTGSSYLRLWEKDSLMRVRTMEQLTSAKLTIQSLSKLLGKISNIVINDQVGEAIYSALQNIQETTEALKQGKLVEAYNKSKSGFLSSEKAFTDPSLLALLYFPDDQKYAVYIPLFLPIMIPILISVKHIKQWAKMKMNQPLKTKTE